MIKLFSLKKEQEEQKEGGPSTGKVAPGLIRMQKGASGARAQPPRAQFFCAVVGRRFLHMIIGARLFCLLRRHE